MPHFRIFFGLCIMAAALLFMAYISGFMFYGIRDNDWPVLKNTMAQKANNLSPWAINKIENSLEKAFVVRGQAYIPVNVFGQPEDYAKTVIELMNRFEDKYKVLVVDYKFATGATEDKEKIFRGIWIIHQSTKQ